MSDWKPIESAEDDWDRAGGRLTFRVKDRDGREWDAHRAVFNNSGWHEIGSNREIWPTHSLPAPPEQEEKP